MEENNSIIGASLCGAGYIICIIGTLMHTHVGRPCGLATRHPSFTQQVRHIVFMITYTLRTSPHPYRTSIQRYTIPRHSYHSSAEVIFTHTG